MAFEDNVFVSGCNVQGSNFSPGDSAGITVTVQNNNDQPANFILDLIVSEEVVGTRERDVPANSSVDIPFSATFEEVGSYDILPNISFVIEA